ncbi:hypothetical protein [Haloplanus rubicundus]|uniref:hypothetical protein n=1 Tax=Haloplanus rubicundus TaxID=1547898 RepID=UPI0013003EBC|nr:hypothetical protein [Haloplanus rubicundus]
MVPLLNRFQGEGEEDDEPLSEERILNVIRESDERVLKTAEIAEELPVTQAWTNTKLNELETKGRVHSKSAGSGRVWWLDDAEPNHYVAESIGDLMYYASEADQAAVNVWLMSLGLFVVAGLLLIPIFLLGMYPSLSVIPYNTQDFATAAILMAIGGGLFLVGGSILKLVSVGIRRRYTTTTSE